MTTNAYAAKPSGADHPRTLEHSAFAQATAALSKVEKLGREAELSMRLDALHTNLKLWNFVLGAVADDRNAFDDDLRSRLAYLARFTEHHTQQARASSLSLAPLVEINLAVMRGLRGIVDVHKGEAA